MGGACSCLAAADSLLAAFGPSGAVSSKCSPAYHFSIGNAWQRSCSSPVRRQQNIVSRSPLGRRTAADIAEQGTLVNDGQGISGGLKMLWVVNADLSHQSSASFHASKHFWLQCLVHVTQRKTSSGTVVKR